MESLDYRYYPVTYNKHSARYFSDGSVRLIVCSENPNSSQDFVGNWIDTCAHEQGTMSWRWVKPASLHDGLHLPRPRTRVLPVAALGSLDRASASTK